MGLGLASYKKEKKWIQKAIKHPGATTEWCKKHGYGGVTSACLSAMKKTGNPTLIRRANLAKTLKKMSKKKKR